MPIEFQGASRGYPHCQFCFGRGCFSCDAQSERDRKHAFENPIYSGNPAGNEEDRARLDDTMRSIFGDAWDKEMRSTTLELCERANATLSSGEKGDDFPKEVELGD